MDNSNTDEAERRPDPIAIGLLRLQQRLDALDRLYNEEVTNLSQELTQLKADYVRLYQAQPTPPSARGGGKTPRAPTTRRTRRKP